MSVLLPEQGRRNKKFVFWQLDWNESNAKQRQKIDFELEIFRWSENAKFMLIGILVLL